MPGKLWIPVLVLFTAILSGLGSCKHEPFASDDEIVPMDTTQNPVDTTGNGIVCDPEVVYFELQVLPILKSNCAFSGCHDAASAEEGVILDSYINVLATAEITPGNISESDLYERLVDDRASRRMPPPPRAPLSQEQIDLIGKWIQQGAEDLDCDQNAGGGCNVTDVTYSGSVAPVIANNCQGCHSGTGASGGVRLDGYDQVKNVASSGKLLGAISWQTGYAQMPQGSAQLPQCSIDQISAWIDAGMPNN
ncbi:MAG: c-type cytochrome domain-containing protein [Saprospiraceae bacterium]|nr:hypothetical protein [Lewinella sp.]